MYSGDEDGRQEFPTEGSAGAAGSPAETDTTDPTAATVGRHDRAGASVRPAALASALDPKAYTHADEPIPNGWPIDYRYLYELVLDRYARNEERAKSLDAKLAALLTGVVASIGFSFRLNASLVNASVALLYLVPLAFVAFAYTAKLQDAAPTIRSMERSFPRYPVSTIVQAIAAICVANEENAKTYDRKAACLDYAVVATIAATLAVLLSQIIAALRTS